MRNFYLLVISTLIFSTTAFAQTTGFTTQPSNASVCLASSGSFTAAVNGNPAVYSVVWQVSTNGGTSWANASGTTTKSNGSSTFTISSASNTSAGLYRAVFTVGVKVFTSNSATLIVNALPIDRTITSPSAGICAGTSVNIILNAPVNNVTYQLRNNSNNSTVGLAQITIGASILKFPTGNLSATTTFNILATYANGCSSQMSVTPTVTVNTPADKTVSAPASVCYGTSANIDVSNPDKNATYQLMNSATNTIVGVSQIGKGSSITFNTGNLTSTSSFYILATSSGCSATMSVKPTISVNQPPVVTVNANYCYGGGKIQLTASSTIPATFVWSNGAKTPSILVDIASNYTVTATTAAGCQATSSRMIAQELVTNGDFSAGNTGFTTGYEYNSQPNGLYPEGFYAVGNNPNYNHSYFFGKDHTTGNGNFMIVNGSPIGDQPTIWEEVVNITPNTTYYFAAWAVSLNDAGNYAQLRFSINGVQIGTTAVLDPGPSSTSDTTHSNWVRFYGTWNSGSATTARIYIIDNQTIRTGNDFGLDDVSFATLAPEAFTASVTNNIGGVACQGSAVNFTTTLNGGLSPFTYSWSGPNSFSSTKKNPSITSSVVANTGSYTLSVTDGFGCPVTVQNAIVINALPLNKILSAPVTIICSGNSVNIQIANSQSGIDYQLRNNASNINIGNDVKGTGSATTPINLSTGNLSATTTFNVIATNQATGCSLQMGNTITITVNPGASISLSSAASTNAQTPCINTAITNITYSIGGGGTNATVTGLPSGVTGTFSGSTFTISGKPTVTGSYTYTVTTSGTCAQTSASGTITVNGISTISLASASSTNAQTVCVNTSIVKIDYTIGGSGTGATVTGLPSSVSGSFNNGKFTINGKPSVSGTFNYTITTTGPCVQASITGSITVMPDATITLSSSASTNSQTICLTNSIADIKYTIGGGATNASVTGLPTGVSGSLSGNVFTISGTPTATGSFTYQVSTTGTCGQVTASGSISVNSNATISLSSAPSTNAQTICISSLITRIDYTVGGSAIGAIVTGLPAGVSGSFNNGKFTIIGTPSASGTFNYTVTTTGSCIQASATGSITITAPPTLSGVTVSSVCANNSATAMLTGMKANSTNNTINYKINGIAQAPVNGVNVNASGNASFTTPMLVQANNGQALQITSIVNGCSASFTTTGIMNVTSSGTWLGVNTNWFDAANWCGGVPTLLTNVLIPVTSSKYYPLVTGAVNATTNNIVIATGASLTVNNGTIQIAGSIANSGSFSAGNGSVEMKSAVAQTIPAKTFTSDSLKNLIISNTSIQGVKLGGTVNLYGTLSFGNNSNQVLASAGYLNLKSTANGTAKVADISNNNSNINNKITGNVIVERYYPARRAWRLVTAPVSAKRSIFNEWQVGGGNTNSFPKAPSNSGTYITSAKPGPGVDKSLNYSMDSFNFAKGTLVGINDTKNTNLSDSAINPGTTPDNKAYFLFVRGDRTPSNITNDGTTCNTTTLRDTGALQTYTKTFTNTLTSKNLFMLVGNPYASPVDFGKITRSSNVSRKFWAWDPKLNERLGSYVLVDGMVGNSYIIVPNGTSVDQNIQSSQAIFVQSVAPGTASVTFEENDKSTVSNNVFRPSSDVTSVESLRANLFLVNSDSTILADGVFAQYDNNFSNNVDIYDAIKFGNFLESFSIVKNGTNLILERRPVLNANDTIFFKLWKTTNRNYRLQFVTDGLNHSGLQGFLEDSYKKSSTPVELNGLTEINFDINNDQASKATDRFRIVFRMLAPLPVSFNKVKAYQKENNINVEWTTENEMNMKQYEVERSTDGLSFTKATTAIATHNNNSAANYQWADANVTGGTYFYRIRSININGDAQYSNIVKVFIGKGKQKISIYPNPVVGGTINLQLTNQPKGNYSVRLTDKLGQVIMVKEVKHEEGSSTETIQLSKLLAHAAYQLEVTKPDNSKTNINVLY